jgi:glycerol-3-phosphate dehydrogenase (NAD(P)+)
MSVLSVALGAKSQTIYGLAGLGDLAATGFSDDSHNRRFGSMLGQGGSTAEIEGRIGMSPEGARTVDIACGWAREKGVAVPVAEFVRDLVAGTKPPLKRLLSYLC